MTTLQTSFELSPAGTAIPTSGVAGDGNAFASGNDGTATFVSDSTTTGAIASGSFCAKITVGATASLCNRNWSLTTGTPAARMYVYLTAYPNAPLELVGPVSSGALLSRVRINTTGTVSYTLGGTAQATTTGTIPLNTLVRLEVDWVLSTTNGTIALDCYSGHSTTPLANLSLTGSGMAMAAATCTTMRLGIPTAGPSSFTFYTDAWGVSDTGRLGPVATPVSVAGSTATVPVRAAGGAAGAFQQVGGVTAVVRAWAAPGAATGGSTVSADWVGAELWNPADPWPGLHGGATLGATAVIWVRAVAGVAGIGDSTSSPVVVPVPVGHEWLMFSRTSGYGLDELLPIVSLDVVRRHMGVSRAVATTSFTPARWESLQPGRGLVAYRDEVEEFTGLVSAREHTWDAESGRMLITIEAVGDEQHLADRLVFPDPLRAADDQTVNDYWQTRTGPTAVARKASTAMLALISDQAGPTCRADRRVPGLVIGDDPGVGVSRVWSGLFDADGPAGVLDLLAKMSVASGQNLGLRMTSAAGVLTASIVLPRNLASSVRFSVDLSNLVGFTYREEAPTVTDAVAAGQGDLHARLRRAVTTVSAAALAWGRRIFRYVDRRDTADAAELVEAATDEVAEGDATVSLAVNLTDSQAATYGRDWGLGDTVTVYVAPPEFEPIATVTDVVREIRMEVSESGAETITPAIGTFDATAVIPTPTQKQLARIGQALGDLKRK